MKKVVVFLLISSFFSVVFLSSCKKYEEGPGVSFISKKKRLAGDWDFESVTITSSGSVDDVTEMYAGAKFNIQEDGTGSFNVPGNSNIPMTWIWGNDKESVLFTIDGDVYEYKILKLKNKELWFEFDADGDVLEIHLKQ